MPKEFLNKIVEEKKKIIQERRPLLDSIRKSIEGTDYTRYSLFKRMISQLDRMNLIAEVKKASPSKGVIRSNFDALEIAKIYQAAGASAISVLTEEKFFLGSPAYLKKINEHLNIATLAKDFFIDEVQVYEARRNGASAILLIMAILEDKQVKSLMSVAHRLDMDCLVEVHDKDELTRAIDCGAEIIGVNNRNLSTFEIDLKTAEELIPLIPKDKIIVGESGLESAQDVQRLRDAGAHAVLIGETFMRVNDIAAKIKEMGF